MPRIATLAAALAAWTGNALAAPSTPAIATTSAHADCIAAFTDYLARYNPDTGATNHGVGASMSDYATSAPRTIASFNISINQLHGSIDDCLLSEP
jgi:hypothetical protein